MRTVNPIDIASQLILCITKIANGKSLCDSGNDAKITDISHIPIRCRNAGKTERS